MAILRYELRSKRFIYYAKTATSLYKRQSVQSHTTGSPILSGLRAGAHSTVLPIKGFTDQFSDGPARMKWMHSGRCRSGAPGRIASARCTFAGHENRLTARQGSVTYSTFRKKMQNRPKVLRWRSRRKWSNCPTAFAHSIGKTFPPSPGYTFDSVNRSMTIPVLRPRTIIDIQESPARVSCRGG